MNMFSNHYSNLADLEYFDPQAFQPDSNVSKELCGFILSLAFIYNDMKNISLFFELTSKSAPEGEFEERKDWGEFNGILNFLDRLIIGLLHELFRLIRDNKKVIDDIYFKQIIKSIRKDVKTSWQALVDTSFDRYSSNQLAKELMIIRNKVSFHYDPKVIKQGYDFFYDKVKKMNRAYISRGRNMQESRYYFADAAGESCIQYISGSVDTHSFFESIDQNLKLLNNSICQIINNFIYKRGFAFHKK